MVSVLYIDMNSYFASVEQQEDPCLRGKPVGIVTVAKKNACCIAASYEAKLRGVKVGTRVDEALKLCPSIVFRSARHDMYVDYHHKILRAVDLIYPVEGIHSVDEYSCRLLGNDSSLEKSIEIATSIRDSIYTHVGDAMHCSIGLGDSRLLAKLAGELHKPKGLDYLLAHEMPEKISHLCLGDIPGIGRNIERRLMKAGICNVRDLYNMAPKHARQIWNSVEGERFLLALRGMEIPDQTFSSNSLGHGQILSPENRTPYNARLVARRLLIKAATRARRGEYFASELSVSFKCARDGRRGESCQFSHTQDSFFLLSTFDQMWRSLTPFKPLSVSVMLGGLSDSTGYTGDLFNVRPSCGEQTEREKLCCLVDQLNQKFGQDTLIYGERPHSIAAYTGAKIAFGRIPTFEEFRD